MQLSNKYNYLHIAEQAGVAVPAMLFLSSAQLQTATWQTTLQQWTNQQTAQWFIVRSAVSVEDTDQSSYAGRFVSSDAVQRAELPSVVYDVYQKNQVAAAACNQPATVSLIVMVYIESQFGGVLFSPWQYFYEHVLVEWAQSPRQAVAGDEVAVGLFAKQAGALQSPEVAALPVRLQTQLREQLAILSTLFSFPLDIEWAYDGTTCYLLQVRPVTIAPTATHIASLPESTTNVYTSLSESLGKLSPLSFALLEYCYTHALAANRALGIAGGCSFLRRQPNGSVLIDPDAYQSYYANTSWYAPFVRAYRARLQLDVLDVPSERDTPRMFDLADCVAAFGAWQQATILQTYSTQADYTYAIPSEYELTQSVDLDQYPMSTVLQRTKYRFLQTLVPLRERVCADPALAWCTDITDLASPQDNTAYAAELFMSLGTYVSPGTNATGRLYGPSVTAAVTVITEPFQLRGPLPLDTIIVTPYIPQSWIPYLPTITGIITSSLSTLSHVAITLREYQIPTVVMSESEREEIKDQSTIKL